MTEIRARLVGEIHADPQTYVDSDRDPTATGDNAPAVGGSPFGAACRSPAGVPWSVLAAIPRSPPTSSTFNTCLAAGTARTALAYLTGTLLAALAAVYAGITIARWGVEIVHRAHQTGR